MKRYYTTKTVISSINKYKERYDHISKILHSTIIYNKKNKISNYTYMLHCAQTSFYKYIVLLCSCKSSFFNSNNTGSSTA